MIEVAIAPYPFTTINPNEGVGYVKIHCVEDFFHVKCKPAHGFCINGNRFVPVKLLDVAGLVPGAHEGKGLGNQFLDDLRQADVLIHIVDAAGATNEKGESVPPGSYDPCNDVEFLENELNYWYAGIFEKNWSKISKQTTDNADKAIAEAFSGLGIKIDMVQKTIDKLKLSEKQLRYWTPEEIKQFAFELRVMAKPIIIAANKIDLPPAKENIKRLKEKFPHYVIVPCSAESELALKEAAKKELIEYIPGESDFKILKSEELNEKQKKALEFIREKILKVWKSTGVQDVLNTAVFDFLKYIPVYTGSPNKLEDSEGRILPDVFLMPPNSTAYNFAEKIHTDLAKGFVRAINVKTKQTVGKDYLLKPNDVIYIVSTK